jgi:ABC-type lipoprotein export system ATPase subunit
LPSRPLKELALEQPIQQPVTTAQRSVIVSVESVTKTYKRGRQKIAVLNSVSLEVYQGEFIAIVGASGSGKSTLLQLIGGLDKPTSGIVKVDNVNINKLHDGKLSEFRNKTIGFVFQFFYLQPFLGLNRNIEVAAMPNRMKRSERKKRILDLAQRVGLADRSKYLPNELSGGQIQRVAIARALLNQPSIILADEPTGNLDSHNSQEIVSLFKSLRDDIGTTVIIATHDASIAAQADRIINIKDGAIV